MSKKKKRILHVLKSSIYSGAENVVITIIKNMQEEYELAYAATDGEIRYVLEREKIEHYLLPQYSRTGICKIIREFKPDIVHAHDFTATAICASVPGKFRLISHLHYDPPWARRWNIKTLAYVAVSVKINDILAVSEGAYRNLVFSKMLRKKTTVVGNPIDAERITALGNTTENSMVYDLLFVGRLVEQKDPKSFIEIVHLLQKKKLYAKCAILGDGILRNECEQLIKQYGLQEQIDLLGFQENPYQYMKRSKLLCMTSKWEGYGLVAVEANILGIPVISTKTGGVLDIFGEQAIELCDTAEEFSDKLYLLLNDEEEYQKWLERAVQRRQQFVLLKDYMNQIKEIYEKE